MSIDRDDEDYMEQLTNLWNVRITPQEGIFEVKPESASKNLDELTGDDFTFKDRINSYAEVTGPISVVNKKQNKDNNGYIYTLKYKVRLNNKVNDDTWYEGQSDVQLLNKVNV